MLADQVDPGAESEKAAKNEINEKAIRDKINAIKRG